MASFHVCPFCKTPSNFADSIQKIEYWCPRCGEYALECAVKDWLPQDLTETQRANISGYLRENPGMFITKPELHFLRNLRTPTVAEKTDKLVLNIAKLFPTPGEIVRIDPDEIIRDSAVLAEVSIAGGDLRRCSVGDATQLRWLSVAWASTADELQYLVSNLLVGTGLIQPVEQEIPGHFQLTPIGWSRADELTHKTLLSDSAFVAMSFHPIFKPLFFEGLEPGIRAARYKALRIDGVQHNNRIDDEIIAAIRRCKFLVADFSLNRGGVYFEAGFAMGLGRPVIWTVREDRTDKIHFDNRQYNFVRWNPGKFGDFAIALQNRIEATIGRGPLGVGISET